MKKENKIEQLFKETFEGFEADVNPQVWTNVQSGIKPVSGGAGPTAAKFAVGKIIAGAASVAIIAGSVWYFSSSKDNAVATPAKQTQNKTASKEISPDSIAGDQPDNAIYNTAGESKMPPAIRSLNHGSSGNITETQIISDPVNNLATEDVSVAGNTNNTSAQAAQHKYGKSSDGPTPLIRGDHGRNPKTKPSKVNAIEEDQDAEQAPNATILASAESGDVPLNVNFSNQGISSALSWDFGDGSTSRENSPSHTFDKPGNYTVKLISKNSAGTSTDKITIEVKSVSAITNIPNIFTPNGDGVNDLFSFEIKNITSIEVVISDLNAHIVAGWSSLEGNWNGKLKNGDDAPEGLYFYTIQAIGTDGVNHPQKGSVSLSRKR